MMGTQLKRSKLAEGALADLKIEIHTHTQCDKAQCVEQAKQSKGTTDSNQIREAYTSAAGTILVE